MPASWYNVLNSFFALPADGTSCVNLCSCLRKLAIRPLLSHSVDSCLCTEKTTPYWTAVNCPSSSVLFSLRVCSKCWLGLGVLKLMRVLPGTNTFPNSWSSERLQIRQWLLRWEHFKAMGMQSHKMDTFDTLQSQKLIGDPDKWSHPANGSDKTIPHAHNAGSAAVAYMPEPKPFDVCACLFSLIPTSTTWAFLKCKFFRLVTINGKPWTCDINTTSHWNQDHRTSKCRMPQKSLKRKAREMRSAYVGN